MLVDYGHLDSEDVLRRGAEACKRALALDPNLAEAHSAWGRLRSCLRDAPGAIVAHERAIELRPSYAGAHQWVCWSHLLLAQGSQAVEFGMKATRLDPLDPEAAGNLAVSYLEVDDPQLALREARRILSSHPTFEYALWVEGMSLHALGRWSEGSEVLGRLRDRWTRGWPEAARALAEIDGDVEPVAREVLEVLHAEGIHFKAGVIHALLDETDEAYDAIRRGLPLPWDEALYLYFHRARPLAALREDPRFEILLEDVLKSWRVVDA